MLQSETLYLQWPTNRKSYMVYRTAPISMTFNDPVSKSHHSWTLNISLFMAVCCR